MNPSKKLKMSFPDNVLQTKDEYNTTRANKPLTERRRRERINNYLDQLKSSIINGDKLQEKRYAKMEKADILEMAVKYIKDKQLQEENLVTNVNQAVFNGYREGYTHCLQEIIKIISTNPYICEQVKNELYVQLSGLNQSTDRTERTTPSSGYPDRTTPPTGYPDRTTPPTGYPDRTTPSTGYPDRTTPSTRHPLYSSHSSTTPSMSDYSSVSSGYLSSSSDFSSESRVCSISDSYNTVPLTSSTPTQIKREVDTPMRTLVSPFVQNSPYSNQQMFNYGYVGQCSDDSVFHANSDYSINHSDSVPSSSLDSVKSESSNVWRPW